MFKKILKHIHESPKLNNLFFKTIRKSNGRAISLLKRKGLNFFTVGDCRQVGTSQEAILSAVEVARSF